MSDNKKHVVDGVLVEWGDQLFYGKVKPKKGSSSDDLLSGVARGLRSSKRSTMQNQGKKGGGVTAAGVRSKLLATVSKKPEVMVKVTGSGRNIKQIKHHLDYVSRNGDLPLEDQDGEQIHGREAVKDLRDEWRYGGFGIPEEGTKARESFNVVLSMPPGTDRLGVTRAARDFARVQFGGSHDYVFATHDDDKHPHVHIVVRAKDYGGKRLNPRKADLQQWREVFAEKLNEHGIEANATNRIARGVNRKTVKRTVIEAEKQGRALPFYRDPNLTDLPGSPAFEASAKTFLKVRQSYQKIAEGLSASPDPEDQKLAADVRGFLMGMPAERRTQSLAELERLAQLSDKRPEMSPKVARTPGPTKRPGRDK